MRIQHTPIRTREVVRSAERREWPCGCLAAEVESSTIRMTVWPHRLDAPRSAAKARRSIRLAVVHYSLQNPAERRIGITSHSRLTGASSRAATPAWPANHDRRPRFAPKVGRDTRRRGTISSTGISNSGKSRARRTSTQGRAPELLRQVLMRPSPARNHAKRPPHKGNLASRHWELRTRTCPAWHYRGAPSSRAAQA